jgi:hypothetical protein
VVLALLLAAASAHARGEGADGEFAKRESSHFILLQDVDIDETGGLRGSRRFERQVLEDLEVAYDRLDQYLGLRPTRKLEVVIYDPLVFDQRFAGLFQFTAAGFYEGIIRVRGADRFTYPLSRVLHHELVHAALDAAGRSAVYPGWFNEGLAEWFEARTHGKRRLDSWELAVLTRARSEGELLSFEALSVPSFSRLPPGSAQLAYLQSYGLMEYLARRHGERSLREFCVELVRTGNLRRTLRRVYDADLSTLAAGFVADLG